MVLLAGLAATLFLAMAIADALARKRRRRKRRAIENPYKTNLVHSNVSYYNGAMNKTGGSPINSNQNLLVSDGKLLSMSVVLDELWSGEYSKRMHEHMYIFHTFSLTQPLLSLST